MEEFNNEYTCETVETGIAAPEREYRFEKGVGVGEVAGIAALVVLGWEGLKWVGNKAMKKIAELQAAKEAKEAANRAQQAPREYVYAEEPEVVKTNKKK